MGFSINTSIPAITVFLQGLLSFFSPCVLPLIPLYMGYLAGGTKSTDEDGTIRYKRSKVMINTLCFIIGVSFAFFLLGFGFTAIGHFFSGNRVWFARIGGIIVILFGLFQLGLFGSKIFKSERRIPLKLNKLAMNPFVAILLGFIFSFAWTPCIGPALASVLLMASSANSAAMGFLLIGVYTLGFVLPFLAVGLFTGTLLDFFKKHQKAVQYTVKVGGALMIFMGIMMITGWMNGITGYLSNFGGGGSNPPPASGSVTSSEDSSQASSSTDGSVSSSSSPNSSESTDSNAGDSKKSPAPDFTLTDQFGKEHKLSDYKGKVVFLNFWASWCGPCKMEMPDIQKLYEKYNHNKGDVIILGIAGPKTSENPNNVDASLDQVKKFLSDNNYTYPVVMDTTGSMFSKFTVTAFPTTYMIDKNGNIFGYATGSLTSSMMESIIQQTVDGKYSSQ